MSRRTRATNSRTYPWSSVDTDRRNSVLLIGGIAAVIVLAVALIGYGYYADRIKPDHASVIQVGNRDFDYAFVERRAHAEQIRGRLDQNDLGTAIYTLLQTIQREEVVRRAAASLDLSVDNDEIEARYRQQLGISADESRDVFASRLRSELVRLGLPLNEYRDITKANLLEQKMRATYEAALPAEIEHLDLKLIQAATQADALKARDRLAAGESFGTLAVELSVHASGKANAGDMSWTPRGTLGKEVEDEAYKVPVGSRSGIIETKEGFFIVEVNGMETRPFTTSGKNAVVQRSLDEQLRLTRDENHADITMTNSQLQKLAVSVGAGRV